MTLKEIFGKVAKWFYDPMDAHCGGCAINCSLQNPNCANGRDKAARFYAKHPELKPEKEKKIIHVEVIPEGKTPRDRINLQAALDQAQGLADGEQLEIELASGTFLIDKCLVVYSDTHLLLKPDTVMRRSDQYRILLKSFTDKKTPGYGNVHDIVIEGGIWDGASTTTDKYKKLIKFSHAENITFRDATVRRVSGKHNVTFAAVRGVRVQNVHFTEFPGYTDIDRKLANAEQLHIDGISDDGVSEPNEQPYDNTPCTDVLIEHCTFDGGYAAIGSHYPPFKGRGCTFRNYKYPPIHIFHFDDVCIENNTFIDCEGYSASDVKNEEPVLRFVHATRAVHDIMEKDCSRADREADKKMCTEETIIGGVRIYDCTNVKVHADKEGKAHI